MFVCWDRRNPEDRPCSLHPSWVRTNHCHRIVGVGCKRRWNKPTQHRKHNLVDRLCSFHPGQIHMSCFHRSEEERHIGCFHRRDHRRTDSLGDRSHSLPACPARRFRCHSCCPPRSGCSGRHDRRHMYSRSGRSHSLPACLVRRFHCRNPGMVSYTFRWSTLDRWGTCNPSRRWSSSRLSLYRRCRCRSRSEHLGRLRCCKFAQKDTCNQPHNSNSSRLSQCRRCRCRNWGETLQRTSPVDQTPCCNIDPSHTGCRSNNHRISCCCRPESHTVPR